MQLTIVHTYLLISLSLVILLIGCEGNSFEETDDALGNIIQLDEKQNINQGIDLLLHYPDDSVSNIHWQQTAGQPVTILAKTSKVISFTPTIAGDYSFSVTYTLNNELEKTLTKSISVSGDAHKVTNRLSHVALAGNKVSFRSQVHENINKNTLVWQQVSGPTVTLTSQNSDGELAIFFDAPNVSA